MYFVIGSGHSGAMCAQALLELGHEVTMLDVGAECEPEKTAVVKTLAGQPPEAWDPALVDKIRGEMKLNSRGIPVKYVYGSGFAYASKSRESVVEENSDVPMSFARGGLSNVWGAAMLPNTELDFQDWPVSAAEMAPHYAAVARSIGIAGRNDDLENIYPYYAAPLQAPSLSRQAAYLLASMEKGRNALKKNGFVFGQARLAMKTQGPEARRCRDSGLCMTGCPYGAIYSTTETLDAFASNPKFSYRPGLAVEKLEESESGAAILCRSLADGKQVRFEARRVFVACGVLSTIKLVVNSLPEPSASLKIQYQPYFMVPVILLKNFPEVKKERLHALSQLFIEIRDASLSKFPVHLQVYTYNDLMRQRFDRMFRALPLLNGWIEKNMLGRLAVVQGYFNSSHAPEGIRVEARKSSGGVPVSLSMKSEVGGETSGRIKRAVEKLGANWKSLGAVPFSPMLTVGTPGYGAHIGAVFPMKHAPRAYESDVYGRVSGFRRVHVVDGSVLSSISSATLAYTMMANARRIAALAAGLD